MIERLLAAERALAGAELDTADRLFRQVVDADPRNAIAVVGLARVAEARGERATARALVERALEIDPEEALARRLRTSLEVDERGRSRDEAEAEVAAAAVSPSAATPAAGAAPRRRGGLLGWLQRLLGRGRPGL